MPCAKSEDQRYRDFSRDKGQNIALAGPTIFGAIRLLIIYHASLDGQVSSQTAKRGTRNVFYSYKLLLHEQHLNTEIQGYL